MEEVHVGYQVSLRMSTGLNTTTKGRRLYFGPDVRTAESIACIAGKTVTHCSLFGRYTFRSYRVSSKCATKAVWVAFDGFALPHWLAVLSRPNTLTLSAADGRQVEAALPSGISNLWPITIASREGLLLHGGATHSPTLFAMTHPLQSLTPVCCDVEHELEPVVFVTNEVYPLVITYNATRQSHALWSLMFSSDCLTISSHARSRPVLRKIKRAVSCNSTAFQTRQAASRVFCKPGEPDILFVCLLTGLPREISRLTVLSVSQGISFAVVDQLSCVDAFPVRKRSALGVDIVVRRENGDIELLDGQSFVSLLVVPREPTSSFLLPYVHTAKICEADEHGWASLRLPDGLKLMQTLVCRNVESKLAEAAVLVFQRVLPQRFCSLV